MLNNIGIQNLFLIKLNNLCMNFLNQLKVLHLNNHYLIQEIQKGFLVQVKLDQKVLYQNININ